ncbi:MAG: sensor domain-containing diguanylate cyclase [Candidatus Edwardsbacteria bacterium]|nr:sensor domain-containing diguanylate cyclase [Candidatus Edwardsbacteria bacterium]
MNALTFIGLGLAAVMFVAVIVVSARLGAKMAALKAAQSELARLKDEENRLRSLASNLKANCTTMEKDQSEKTRSFMVLLELARTLGGNLEENKLPALLLRIAQQLFDAEELAIFKPGEDGHEFTVFDSIGIDDQAVRDLAVKLGDGYVGHTAAKRLIMTKEDFQKESNLVKQRLETTKEPGLNPVFCIPLMQHNTMLGVVTVGKVTRRAKDERDLLLIYQSLSSMAMDNARLFQQLYTKDKLTGLYNRRFFEERAQAELSRAKRFGHKLSFALLDIDNFKSFKEANGTQAAERVIGRVGAILEEHVRRIDISSRWEADQFAVALLETERPQALQFAEKIKRFIDEDPAIHDQAFAVQRLTSSIVVFTFPDDGFSMHQMFDAAGKRLVEAQAKGGNVVLREITA